MRGQPLHCPRNRVRYTFYPFPFPALLAETAAKLDDLGERLDAFRKDRRSIAARQ
jgi:hypothetical protein